MVHQYKLNGYNIVLDTASGSVHVVDEVAYDIIELYKEKEKDEIVKIISERYKDMDDVTPSEIEECIDDIKSLEDSGKLFSVDKYERLAEEYKSNSNKMDFISSYYLCNYIL